jgi:outer membrane protein TolC
MKRSAGAAVLLVAMAGCAVGPDFQRPAGPAADRYTIDALRSESPDGAAGTAQHLALGRGIEGNWWQHHDAEQLEAQRHAVEAAQNNVRLSQLSYHEGNVGVLQVLDAQRQFQQAKLGFVRAQTQRYIDTAQLFLALGGSTLPSS